MGSAAQKGDRECHFAVLMDDDNISWDKQYPPEKGEEHILKV